MNKIKTIITSAVLASIAALSVPVSVAAKEVESDSSFNSRRINYNNEHHIYYDFEYILDDNEWELVADESRIGVIINGVNMPLTESAFSALKENVGKRVYFAERDTVTSGGTEGTLTIHSGVYTTVEKVAENEYLKYYGVSAEITGGSGDLENAATDISIYAEFFSEDDSFPFNISADTNELFLEELNGKFIGVHSEIITNSEAFGHSYEQINAAFESHVRGRT